jgi:hypothetical protein
MLLTFMGDAMRDAFDTRRAKAVKAALMSPAEFQFD